LIRLGDVCGEESWLRVAERVLRAHVNAAMENPFGYSNLLNALDLFQRHPAEIVLAGADTTPLARALAEVWLPDRVIVRAEGAPALVNKLTDGKTPVDGKPAAYVCRDFTCQKPITDPGELTLTLRNP